MPGSGYTLDELGVLVRQAQIDVAVQRRVPLSSRPKILHLAHHSTMAGHPGERRMQDSLRRKYCWLHIASDVEEVVRNCADCTKTGTKFNHQHRLLLFQPSAPVEFVAIGILGPLQKASTGNQYVVVMTD